MNKFIVSSHSLGAFMGKIFWEVTKDDMYLLRVKGKTLSFKRYHLQVESKLDAEWGIVISVDQVKTIRDQPLTISNNTANWLTIEGIVI